MKRQKFKGKSSLFSFFNFPSPSSKRKALLSPPPFLPPVTNSPAFSRDCPFLPLEHIQAEPYAYVYADFLSPNFCFSFPKNPLPRFFALSALSWSLLVASFALDAVAAAAAGFELVAFFDVVGAAPVLMPDVTIGCVCAAVPSGRVMGEMSLDSASRFLAFSAAGVPAGTSADVGAAGSETAAAVSVGMERGSVGAFAGGLLVVDAGVEVSGWTELAVGAGAESMSAALVAGAGSPVDWSGLVPLRSSASTLRFSCTMPLSPAASGDW